jgi:Bifunctional DNA primase/polymerase, N-terminal
MTLPHINGAGPFPVRTPPSAINGVELDPMAPQVDPPDGTSAISSPGDTSKLYAALTLAQRGLFVFPLKPNSKIPLHKGWQLEATNDPRKVRDMWTRPDGTPRNCNIGVFCHNKLVVIDVDKKGDVNGYPALAAMGPIGPTYRSGTTTGGEHIYLEGEGFDQRRIAPGLDVRANGKGYVVGVGSTIDGKAYVELENAPIAPVPENVAAHVKRSAKCASAASPDTASRSAHRASKAQPM